MLGSSTFLASSLSVIMPGVLMCSAHLHRIFPSMRILAGNPSEENHSIDYAHKHRPFSPSSLPNKLILFGKAMCLAKNNNNKVPQVSWKNWMAMRHRSNQKDTGIPQQHCWLSSTPPQEAQLAACFSTQPDHFLLLIERADV